MGIRHDPRGVVVAWSLLNVLDFTVPHITRDSLPYQSAGVIEEMVSSNE